MIQEKAELTAAHLKTPWHAPKASSQLESLGRFICVRFAPSLCSGLSRQSSAGLAFLVDIAGFGEPSSLNGPSTSQRAIHHLFLLLIAETNSITHRSRARRF